MRVIVPLPSGKTWRYDVRTIFDYKSHLFWWELTNLGEYYAEMKIGEMMKNKSIIIKERNKIVGFKYSTGTITVNQSSDQHLSIGDGQNIIIATFKHKINEIEKGGSILPYKHIEAGKVMMSTFGPNFFHDFSKNLSPKPKLINVKKGKKDKNWHLIFEGVNKSKGEIILSEDYQVLGAALLSNSNSHFALKPLKYRL